MAVALEVSCACCTEGESAVVNIHLRLLPGVLFMGLLVDA